MPKNGRTNYVKHWRQIRGLEQKDLAERAEISAALISLIESGKRNLSPEVKKKIARVLRVKPAALTRDPYKMF